MAISMTTVATCLQMPTRRGSRDGRRRPRAAAPISAEPTIERLSREIARIDAALAVPGLFVRDPPVAAALSKARAEAVASLGRAENDWLAASTELEAAMA